MARSAAGIYTLNNWNHALAIHSSSGAQIYLNSDIVAQTRSSNGQHIMITGIHFGRDNNSFHGYLTDHALWARILSNNEILALADPSNVDLRVGGVPLILPPRRRIWPVAPVAEAVFLKRRNLGLRAGSREAVI